MDMSGLSPDQLKKLGKTIEEAKGLTNAQADIIKQIIDGEIDIGKLRIAYLDMFFDTYFTGLDQVSRKQSELNDTLLVLNNEAAKKAQKAHFVDDESIAKRKKVTDEEIADLKTKEKTVFAIVDEETNKKLKESEKLHKTAINQEKQISNFIEANMAQYYKNLEQIDNYIEDNYRKRTAENQATDVYEEARQKKRQERHEKLAKLERASEAALIDLYNLRHEDEIDKADRISAVRLSRIQEVTKAEIASIELTKQMEAEMAYASQENYVTDDGVDTGVNEAGALRAREAEAQQKLKSEQAIQKALIAWREKEERKSRRKNNQELLKEESTRINKSMDEMYKRMKANQEKLAKEQAALDDAHAQTEAREQMSKDANNLLHAKTTTERYEALKRLTTDEEGNFDSQKALEAGLKMISDLAAQLEKKIDEIASFKGEIDTRLQGSNNEKFAGSYWDQLVRDMTEVGAINPYFKQETFANNIKSLVDKGIAFDLKQRAFLMTIQDKIATTFDVADGTLLRLIRIQQEDSTAGRLGMESALNSFLNTMYENTEYLKTVADGVRGNLEEMQSLMKGAEATEVEYQVQKWLGSLYSVGMSQSAVQSISTALGQIAAGQIEGLNGGAGNLMVMAANDAGLSIADILTDGLDSSKTNMLLQSMVKYLAELAESSKDNKIVQQQLAEVFGVKASDLKAATNLVLPGTVSNIYSDSMTYKTMLSQLMGMASSMGSRTSIAEKMTNFWDNGQYTLAGSMASNPVSYFIYKMAKVVDDAAGGIDLPFLNVMGFGVDLNTTVSDLMRVAAVGAGILGSAAPLISGLGSSFSGQAMLNKLGIKSKSGLTVTPRGDGGNLLGANAADGASLSESGYVGNASGSDIKDSTMQEAENSKKQQMIEAKEEEEANKVDVLNATVIKIYELLDDVAHGGGYFNVKVAGYGLTNSGVRRSGALGGVDALSDINDSGGHAGLSAAGGGGGSGSGSNSGYNGYTGSSGSANTGGVGSSINLGGWMTTL